ncbi:MAG: 30S ribosomal protein S9, partial [Patescibacteria group bacterium]
MALQNVKKSAPMKVNKKGVAVVAGGATTGAVVGQPTPKGEYIVAIGRRKVATARVRLYRGKGQSTVNGKPLNEYFSSVDPQGVTFAKPLTIVGLVGAVYVTVKVGGSGMRAQADAVCHGVA